MALEHRSSYLGTQSDMHTHAHDLPPQMGCCLASGTVEQTAAAKAIDQGPWPSPNPAVIETRQPEPAAVAFEALARQASGLSQGNPFPLIFEGELAPL